MPTSLTIVVQTTESFEVIVEDGRNVDLSKVEISDNVPLPPGVTIAIRSREVSRMTLDESNPLSRILAQPLGKLPTGNKPRH